MSSIADIVANLLVQNLPATAVALGGSTDWAVFVSHMPSSPKNVIVVGSLAGRTQGRIHRTGKTVNLHAVKITVRSQTYQAGESRIHSISEYVDTVLRKDVLVNGESIRIQAITKNTPVIPMGANPESRLELFSFDCTVTLVDAP